LIKGHGWLSAELYGIVFVSVHAPQCKKETHVLVTNMLEVLLASRKPFVILGDFNHDVTAMQHWLYGAGFPQIIALNFGPTCTTAKGKTSIDYALVSPQAAFAVVRFSVQETSLATNNTLHLHMDVTAHDAQYVYTVWDRVGPVKGNLARPRWQNATSAAKWQLAFSQLPHDPSQASIDSLYALWLEWAHSEISSNFQCEVDTRAGAAFPIRETTPPAEIQALQQQRRPLANDRMMAWGLRRAQGLLASQRHNGPKPSTVAQWADLLWLHHLGHNVPEIASLPMDLRKIDDFHCQV
jgi:hypothetical protein